MFYSKVNSAVCD